jgi:hypothetical protein
MSHRKRGGQFGHPKRTRPLIPTEDCDRVQHHRPTACTNCGTRLRGHDPNPERHQITELPAAKPTITEHQIHTLQCPDSGHRCRGQLPGTVPCGCFGPRVVATVTLLSSLGRNGFTTGTTCSRGRFSGPRSMVTTGDVAVKSLMLCWTARTATSRRPRKHVAVWATSVTVCLCSWITRLPRTTRPNRPSGSR